MAKALKVIVVVLLGLALLAALGVTILPKALPLSSMLAGALEENLGRKATVDEVSVSLWGGLDVKVRGLVVQDKPAYGNRPLLKLDSLELSASLWPLLTRRLVVEKVLADGLELSVVRAKDGRLNWQDLPSQAEAGEKHEPREAPEGGRLLINRLAVTNSSLHLLNQTDGKRSVLPLERCELSSDLSLGGASGELELALPGISLNSSAKSQGYGDAFKLDQGRLELKIDLAQLTARLAPLAPGLRARGVIMVTGRVSGPASALQVQTQAQARDLRVQTQAMGPKAFSLGEASWAGQATFDLPGELVNIKQAQLLLPQAGMVQTLSGVLGWGKSLGKSDAVYDQQADLAKLARFIEPLLPWPLKAKGQASKRVLFKGAGPGVLAVSGQNLLRGAVVESPAWPRPWKEPEARADYKFLVKDKGREVVIERFDLLSTPAKLGLTGVLRVVKDQTTLRLKLAGEYLDLDRLPLGPPPARRASARASTGKAAKPGAKVLAGQPAKSPQTARPEADARRALKGLDAEVRVQLDRLTMSGYRMTGLKAQLQVKKQQAEIKSLQARFLEGQVKASAGVDFKPASPAVSLRVQGKDLKVDPKVFRKLKDDFPLFALPLSSLEGVFSLDSEMAGQGLEPEALLASLAGKGSLRAKDGVIIGLAFLDDAQSVAQLFGGKLPRRFEKFQGDYTMGQGKVNYDIALMAAKDEMDAQIVGSTGLLDDSLDAKIKFKADTVGHTLREFLDADGTFPIGLGGTIHKPVVKLDLRGNLIPAAENLIKNLLNR
ncbi:MAG: AsmA family protein [Proteobacteria bacterium]|nr:AsmA family protein [Pseudomonadota bacterium]MBU1449963.1 AsmA family protein [Pseudomonadota bacterium]MBU2469868.1 AsmA family protein [Pseudomonadota bacterium]MBU2516170.1 AsmA family protein [Pseudomonadota bacterium]